MVGVTCFELEGALCSFLCSGAINVDWGGTMHVHRRAQVVVRLHIQRKVLLEEMNFVVSKYLQWH
jgi:hypothetical protein